MYNPSEVQQIKEVIAAAEVVEAFLAGLIVDEYTEGRAAPEFQAGLLADLSALSDALRQDLRRDGVKVNRRKMLLVA